MARLERIATEMAKHVKAGILEPEASKIHDENSWRDKPATIGEVAAYNEFGTETTPERSFLRTPFEANLDKYRAQIERDTPAVMEGTMSAHQVLQDIGDEMVLDMHDAIDAGIPPPNADSTIARKWSDTPLRDTDTLRDAIRAEVGEGEVDE